MLIFPAEPPDTGLSGGLDDRNTNRLAADLAVCAPTLLTSQVEQSLVRDRFHEAIPQQVQGEARRPDPFAFGRPLLNLRIREGRVGADGTIVDQRAAGNDFGATGNRDVRVTKASVRSQMPDAQFRELGRATRCRILVTLPAGLRVIKRTQPIGNIFYLIEALP